jgi:hypothetical protein
VDQVHELPVAVIAPRHALTQVGREPGPAPVGAEEVPEQGHPGPVQGPQVQVVAAAVAGGEDVRLQPRRGARERLDRVVQEPGFGRPPDQVVVADPAGHPRGSPAGKEHVASGLVQFLRDLAAGLAAPDHEHFAGRQRTGASVLGEFDLHQIGRQGIGAGGPVGPLIRAGANDHGRGEDVAARRPQEVPALRRRLQGGHVDPLAKRGPEAGGVPFQVLDDFVSNHEAVGIVAVVCAASREPHRPVRRDQAEAVPAIPPGLAHADPLENDVLDASLRQLMARRQARLAATDDHDLDVLRHRRGWYEPGERLGRSFPQRSARKRPTVIRRSIHHPPSAIRPSIATEGEGLGESAHRRDPPDGPPPPRWEGREA